MSEETDAAPLVSCERHGRVALLRIAHPKLNVLSLAVADAFERELDALEADLPGALVITGSDRAFAAGADIGELSDPATVGELVDALRRVCDRVALFPRVTIAAIAGFALGGGCELAISCDFRLAAPSARIGLPEVTLGIFPGSGGTQRLARLVGVTKAKELVFSGRHVNPQEALEIGLVSKVIEAQEFVTAAIEEAERFAEGAVAAQGLAKRAIDDGLDLPIAAALNRERELFDAVRATEDASIGLTSFLANGPGKADFVGR